MSLDLQILNALAALFLLLSFAMLSQRRIVTLVNLLALQGVLLGSATVVLAPTGQVLVDQLGPAVDTD